MVSKTVLAEENSLANQVIGKENQIFSVAGARVYFSRANEREWNLLNESGIMTFYQDADSGILHLKLVDSNKKACVWHQEIYLEFEYHGDSDLFHTFEGDDGLYGILFADKHDAKDFHDSLSKQLSQASHYNNAKSDSKKKTKSIFSTVFGFGSKKKNIENTKAGDQADEADEEVEDCLSIGSKKTKEKRSKKHDDWLTHDDVSEPRDFTHLSHIGFNPEKGTFDVKNIPDDWKSIFSKAGITQEQLENRSTANFIAGFVSDQAGNEVVKKKKAAPPPPPIPVSRRSRPPPVSPGGKKLPPPPPKRKSAPLPSTSSGSSAPVGATTQYSRLMSSIKNTSISNLKSAPVSKPESSSSPLVNDSHSALLASIRSAGPLRSTPQNNENDGVDPKVSHPDTSDPTDMMAALLAKALAARNQKLSTVDSDEESDGNW